MGVFDKVGGRKALGGALVVALGFAVDFFVPRGLSEHFMMLMLGVYGTYVAGNSAGKFAVAKQAVVDKGAAERELAQSVDLLAKQYENVQQGLSDVRKQGESHMEAVTQLAKSIAQILGGKKS